MFHELFILELVAELVIFLVQECMM